MASQISIHPRSSGDKPSLAIRGGRVSEGVSLRRASGVDSEVPEESTTGSNNRRGGRAAALSA
jgi:hypothetical protein